MNPNRFTMETETYTGDLYAIDTPEGTQYVPGELLGRVPEIQDGQTIEPDTPAHRILFDALAPFVSGEIECVTWTAEGKLYRRALAGDVDVSDWTIEPLAA